MPSLMNIDTAVGTGVSDLIRRVKSAGDTGVADLIRRAVQQDVDKILAEEAAKAATRVEQRVRERTAVIVCAVMDRFSFERYGEKLRIEVDFKRD